MGATNGYIIGKKKTQTTLAVTVRSLQNLLREGNFPLSKTLESHCGSVGELCSEHLLVLQPIMTSS